MCLTDEGQKKRTVCPGDSGGPIVWDDDRDAKRGYHVGVISSSQGFCYNSDPRRIYLPAKAVWVPAVMDWLVSVGGKELEDCLLEVPWIVILFQLDIQSKIECQKRNNCKSISQHWIEKRSN